MRNFRNINPLNQKIMAKSKNESTSKNIASIASKLLSDPKSSKDVKSVAASALTQAQNKKK